MAAITKTTRKSYFDTLDEASKRRYLEKFTVISDQDPYTLESSKFTADPSSLLSVSYPDIVNCLVYSPSPYTLEDLKCYKGLDAYNQFVSGWVRDVRSSVINGLHLVVGRVMHSQRLSETPLRPWFIAEKEGKIICGHCDCMAGLGETCTHVSALLFYVDTTARIRDSRTVTAEPANWKLPTGARDQVVSYLLVNQIDFTSAKSKKRNLDSLVNGSDFPQTPLSSRTPRTIPQPTNAEVSQFLEKLAAAGSKAAILSVTPHHSKEFIPTSLQGRYPVSLTELYDPELSRLAYPDLVEKCQDVELSVTIDQAKCLEEATRAQSSSKLWYRFRSDRITASKMKRVCRTNQEQPAQSLIKTVCYPASHAFSTSATNWGWEHEETVRNAYLERMVHAHDNFQVYPCGFVITPIYYYYMGASPDGKVSCDCCGDGLVEIKCPYCARDCTIAELTATGFKSCLTEKDGHPSVKRDLEYMYQVQTQLHVCGVDYVDFVVWTKNDLHLERVESDPEIWTEICGKARQFFDKAVLPELLGKYFSKPLGDISGAEKDTDESSHNAVSSTDPVFCYCKQPEDADDMIACGNENCKVVWYYIGCLKIKSVPKGKWFCPDCPKPKKAKKI